MIRRASCGSRCDALEAECCKIELIDAGLERTDRTLFREVGVEALWKEAHLVTMRALDVTHNSTKLQERGSKWDVLYYLKSWGFDTV
jgi:hypothetical protein